MKLPEELGLLGMMPAWLGEPACFGIKVISVMPGNHGSPYDAHQGSILLFEPDHGRLIAIIDASSVTGIRTAAASGVATRALANPDACDLAIIGTGVQATTHLEAMGCVRRLRRVRVSSGNPENARAFARQASADMGLDVQACESNQGCVDGADIICTVTSSAEPVIESPWIADGTHINAVGACTPRTRELDGPTMKRATIFTDRMESLLNEAGDFLLARAEGAIDEDHPVTELGTVLEGQKPGRSDATQLTVFESLGIGIEDLAVAHHLAGRARQEGVGSEIELGGLRDG